MDIFMQNMFKNNKRKKFVLSIRRNMEIEEKKLMLKKLLDILA